MKQISLTLAVALGLGVAGPAALAQDPPQIFRGAVRTVPIYATVVDAKGRLVPDLVQSDFEVLDNLKPAQITNFRIEVFPISVVLAIDLSASMVNDLKIAKDATEAFILRLLPHDRARIVGFDDLVRWSPAFTSDRDALITHLRSELRFGNSTRLWDALYESVGTLREEKSRKVVVVLSDGDDYGSKNAGDGDVLRMAQEDDVMIYTVGLRTWYRGGPNGSFIQGRPDRDLKKMSEHTGGGYFELTKSTELNSTFSRVAEEVHRQYLLAIPAQEDGKEHTLSVRAKVPGLTVRARRTYLAAPQVK
jgi:VWFA-related protein